jgi:single-stranded-DNA-specific exonuclease
LPEKIDEFRKKFNEAVEKYSAIAPHREKIEYSSELNLEDIDNGFIDEMEMLQPFGQRNPDPIFLLKNIKIHNLPETFGAQKTHVKFWLVDRHSKRTLAIAWHAADNIPPIRTYLDFLVTVNREMWNKIHSTCLHVVDWRIAKGD